MILFFFFRNCLKITDEVSQNRCCKQMNPVGLHVTTQNYNQYLISRYKRNQSRKTKQYHYQFPKVNQMFCYIKHCNHLFCPDFAKAIKYGCENFKIKSIFLRSIPHAQPHNKSTTLKQAASTGLRKFSTQLVHLLKRCIKYKIASAFCCQARIRRGILKDQSMEVNRIESSFNW